MSKNKKYYYEFYQNNSGGFIKTCKISGVDKKIFIRAVNVDHAIAKFERIREAYNKNNNNDFDSYCECCGERWNEDEDNLEEYKVRTLQFTDWVGFGELKLLSKEEYKEPYYIHYLDQNGNDINFEGFNIK